VTDEKILEVYDLKKWFPVKSSFLSSIILRKKSFLRAVDGISFDIKRGEIMALAGESGCGKTTTGRLLVLLDEPTDGKILFNGIDISSLKGKQLKYFRKRIQMIFQDPYESLNPRFTILNAVTEPLKAHKIGSKDEWIEMAYKMLAYAGLTPPEKFFNRYPHELSGGERQRVAIARAMIIRPEFIVADEPVSMLDISVRAGILNLMKKLNKELGIAYLFITHDLAVARYMSHKIAIMYLGKILEIGPTEKVISNPKHPYTKLLLSAIPRPGLKRRRRVTMTEVPSPINLPEGCRFHPRCPYVLNVCKQREPPLSEVEKGYKVACHLISSN